VPDVIGQDAGSASRIERLAGAVQLAREQRDRNGHLIRLPWRISNRVARPGGVAPRRPSVR